jgi:hypothetical protein
MWARLVGGILLVALAGCDPGFVYMLPGAQRLADDGPIRYAVRADDDVLARFRASVFTVHGGVEVDVLNQGDTPLSFVPTATLIVYADGSRVEPRDCRFWKLPAMGVSQGIEVIGNGQGERISCGFDIHVGFWRPYRPETARVSIRQPGFWRSGRPLEIHASMIDPRRATE